MGAKRANTSVNSGAELLKSRQDYRSRSDKGEYFGKFRGGAIEIKTRSRQDYRSGSDKGEYFGKYLSQASEARLRLWKYEQEWR